MKNKTLFYAIESALLTLVAMASVVLILKGDMIGFGLLAMVAAGAAWIYTIGQSLDDTE